MKDDNELIDAAMDAAQVKLEEKQDAPLADTAETPEPVEAALEAEDTHREDEISGQGAEIEGNKAAKGAETPDEAPIEAPAFWSAELKATLAKAPREVQKAVADHEAQRNDWANRVANEAQRGKQIEAKATELFEPYRLKLQAQGIKDPLEAAERLLAWDEIFTKDVKLGISDLMRKNGLTPHDFLNDGQEQYQQVDPMVQQALDEAREAKVYAEEQRGYFEQQRQETVRAGLEAFKNGTDSSGQTRRAFADMYEPQITSALNEIRSGWPNIPMFEALNHAHEFVLNEVQQMHGKPAAPSPTREQVIANANKAKAAASSNVGAPATSRVSQRPKLKGKTFEEKLESAYAIAEQRAYGN